MNLEKTLSAYASFISYLKSLKDNEKEIIRFYDAGSATDSLSFKDIFARASARAQILKQYSIPHQTPVLLEGTNDSNFVISFFAIQMVGAIPVPVSSGQWLSEKRFLDLIANIQLHTKASVFLSSKTDKKLLDEKLYIPGFTVIDSADLKEDIALQGEIYIPKAEDTAFIQFSSGSTGDPKGVVLSHRNVLANLCQISEGSEINRETDRVASWLPVHHDMGLIGCVLSPMFNQTVLHLMKPYDFLVNPKRWLKLITQERITIICAPNSAYHICTTKVKPEKRGDLDLSSLRLALCGAEPINTKTLNAFLDSFAANGLKRNVFLPCYGMAENVLAITFTKCGEEIKIDSIDKDALFNEMKAVPTTSDVSLKVVSCGKPLTGIEVRIVNDQDEVLSERQVGHIQVKSPSTTKGYFERPDLNAKLFKDGFLRTGDLGYIHDGEVYITGRYKDLIIINGSNICPEEIEKQMTEVSSVKPGRLASFAVPTEDGSSEEIRIVVEVKKRVLFFRNRGSVKQEIAQTLSRIISIKPEQISIVPPGTIRKTTSGKIKRAEMKKLYLSGKIDIAEKNYIIYLLLYKSKESLMNMRIALNDQLGIKTSAR